MPRDKQEQPPRMAKRAKSPSETPTRRHLFIGIGILVLLLGVIAFATNRRGLEAVVKGVSTGNGFGLSARPAPDPNPTNTLKIFNEYHNEAAGDAKHKDQWITIEASVASVRKNSDGSYTAYLMMYFNRPHGAEMTFEQSEADKVGGLKTIGPSGAPNYLFHARCIGRKEAYQPRNQHIANTSYVVAFDRGIILKKD